MADYLPPLVGHLMGDIAHFAGKMGEATAIAKKETTAQAEMFNGLATVGKAAFFGVGAAAVAGLGASVGMAADFQSQMTKLVGTAGESEGQIGLVSRGILDMAGAVGYSARSLADGMYMVESAGFHGGQGLDVLRASAMAAKAENADMKVVADAVTSALNAYSMSGDKATKVTDMLLQATAQGKMTFQDLAGSLYHVLPIAATAHIGLNEVTAALATMTMQGVPAEVAATDLQYAIKGLEVPSKIAQAEFKKLGMDAHHFANELQSKGLAATIQDLTTSVGQKFPAGSAQYNEAVSRIVGNVEGLNAILMVSGDHTKTFHNNLTAGASASGKTNQAFNEQIGTLSGRWSQVTSGAEAYGIKLGTVVIPYTLKAMDGIANLSSWLSKHRDTTIAIAGAIAGPLAVAMTLWIIQLGIAAVETVAATWPLLAIIAVVALLSAGIALLVTHWSDVVRWLGHAKDWFLQVAESVWQVIDRNTALKAILAVILGPIGAVILVVKELHDDWNQVTSAIQGAAGALGDFAAQARNMPVVGGLGHALGIPGFATGGVVPGPLGAPRLVIAHGGETITPPGAGAPNGAPDGGRSQVVNVYVATDADPYEIGRETAWAMKYM